MITGRDIVFLSSMDWDSLWQAHHELASRLAGNGNRVLYVENIGFRAPRWEDRSRVLDRLRRWSVGLLRGGPRRVSDRLWVSAPLLLPPFSGRLGRLLNRHLLIPLIARSTRQLGLRSPIVWTYLPTDTAAALIEALRSPDSPVVYSCLADFGALAAPGDVDAVVTAERRLLESCDLVFALPGLADRCRLHSANVREYEPAVSTELFHPTGTTGPHLRPVIGYVGGLQRHVDLALLIQLVDARPQWSWVFAGPAFVPVDDLAARSNVQLLGEMKHDELPDVIASFDVGIVPYVLSTYTASVVPTKVGEYLAMGKPVVSTPLPHALELERTSDGVVLTAPLVRDDFLAALERALLRGRAAGTVEQCRRIAERRSWTQQIEQMSEAIEGSATVVSRSGSDEGRRRSA